MADISTGTFISSLIDQLIARGVDASQNGMIHALGIWLNDNIHGDFAEKRKREAGAKFYELVSNFVEKNMVPRKVWSETYSPVRREDQWAASLEISARVLARVNGMSFEQGLALMAHIYGAWILACPLVVIQSSSAYTSLPVAVTNVDLVDALLRTLDFYLTI